MTLTQKQSERILDDAKRIALVTSGIQCNVDCLKKIIDTESMSENLKSRLDDICQCLEVKAMLIAGFGNSLYDDILGMKEYNENERTNITVDTGS